MYYAGTLFVSLFPTEKKRFFSSLKKKLSVIEYSKIDQLTTNHLREMDEEEQKGM